MLCCLPRLPPQVKSFRITDWDLFAKSGELGRHCSRPPAEPGGLAG